MKKLLFLFDTDPYPSVFDTVVAYDGGADRVAGYANVTPGNVAEGSDRAELHHDRPVGVPGERHARLEEDIRTSLPR